MADRMPPPGMSIAIGAKDDAPKNGRMPPPGMGEPPKTGKASPEEAEVIRSDEHCLDCVHYDPTSGECAKVEGSFDPQDACSEFFQKIGSDEPDEDDMGGPPDGDEDDSGMPA